MKIREIRTAGLKGATPQGGWSSELAQEDSVHTLVVVFTDEGVTGVGSVFTNSNLVHAALAVLEPPYRDENALEPERVNEKLHQNTFWLGRGGSITHTISGVDIALWDILGKVTGQPVGRLLGGRYRDKVKPYASLLADVPEILAQHLSELRQQGFQAFKIGWGPLGRVSPNMDESIENGIKYIPHGWNTAVGLTADLQLASAFADTDLVEYIPISFVGFCSSTQPTNKPWPMLEPRPKNGIVEFWNDGFKENEIQSTSLIKIWHSISDCHR